MGLLAKHLEDSGITTAIEKDNNQNNLEEGNTTLQFMINGLGKRKNIIYILILMKKEMKNY